MPHIRCITAPKKASIIVDDPDGGSGDGIGTDGIIEIMESFFGFVFDYIEIKGKAASA